MTDEGSSGGDESAEAAASAGEGSASAGEGAGGGPSEEEMRAQLEDEIRQVRIEQLVLQSAVSILNLSARRIAKEDERDLEQAKVGIDAADALIDHVPDDAQGQLRQAVSELKMLFAQHSGEGGGAEAPDPGDSPKKPGDSPKKPDGPGLWTPGS